MPLDPDDANQPTELDSAEKKMQSTTGKEWLFVYVFILVFIVIVALTAYHLTHG
jgi:hypothetical protein